MIQGRLDIAAAAVAAQAAGEESSVEAIIAKLPEILSEDSTKAFPVMRPEGMIDFAETGSGYVAELVAELDAIANMMAASESTGTTTAPAGLIDALNDLEHKVSSLRKRIHDQIDLLQEEIVRRYKSGEATVDSLLGQ